jgi:hypothetical protein
MAARTLKYTEWLKLVAQHALGGEFANVSGYPVADTARRLSVSEQRVRQLIDESVLDTLHVTTAAGKVALTLVTEASLERYLAARVPDRNRQGYFAFPS